MRIEKDNIVIRSANLKDAEILNHWWNDGSVMEHAGFPNGLGQSMEETIECVKRNEGHISQLCIIEIDGKPVGELNYSIMILHIPVGKSVKKNIRIKAMVQ